MRVVEYVPAPLVANHVKVSAVGQTSPFQLHADGRYRPDEFIADGVRTAFYTEGWSYINHTPEDIIIRDRCGLSINIPSRPNAQRHGFYIVRAFRVRGDSVASFMQSVRQGMGGDSLELYELNRAIAKIKPNIREFTCSLEYEISLESLSDHSGAVYHHQSDKIVAIKGRDAKAVHPHSSCRMDVGPFGRVDICPQGDDTDVKIRYESLTPEPKTLYGVFANQIFSIRSQTRFPARVIPRNAMKTETPIYEDRVVVYRNEKKPNGEVVVKRTIYSVAEAKTELGLYDTPEQAKAFGKPEDLHRKKMLEMEQALEVQKRENLHLKSVAEHASQSGGIELLRAQQALEQLRHETTVRKEQADRAASDLKLELVKAQEASARAQQELEAFKRRSEEASIILKQQADVAARAREQAAAEIASLQTRLDAERKAHMAELENAQKLRMLEIKDSYEHKSLHRKDSVESSKLSGTLLLGVVTLVTAFVKLFGGR